jgi:hypothetical protein
MARTPPEKFLELEHPKSNGFFILDYFSIRALGKSRHWSCGISSFAIGEPRMNEHLGSGSRKSQGPSTARAVHKGPLREIARNVGVLILLMLGVWLLASIVLLL